MSAFIALTRLPQYDAVRVRSEHIMWYAALDGGSQLYLLDGSQIGVKESPARIDMLLSSNPIPGARTGNTEVRTSPVPPPEDGLDLLSPVAVPARGPTWTRGPPEPQDYVVPLDSLIPMEINRCVQDKTVYHVVGENWDSCRTVNFGWTEIQPHPIPSLSHVLGVIPVNEGRISKHPIREFYILQRDLPSGDYPAAFPCPRFERVAQDGNRVNNCNLNFEGGEARCQICLGNCPDRKN